MAATDINAATPGAGARLGPIALVIGFCLFATVQLSLTVTPALNRSIPAWPIDAFMYMAKAEQVRSCFRQECPALEALRPQLTATTENAEVRTIRERQYHRVLYQYHLLHSFVLDRLERVTGNWQTAYEAIAMAGGLLVALSITAFIAWLYGPAAGGFGLAILSTAVFPGFHGIHWIVPSNMALALGFLSWGLIIRRHPLSLPTLPVFAVAMVALHTVGQIYAGIGMLLAAYVALRRGPPAWLWIGLSGLVLAANAVLPRFVERPSLYLLRETLPEDTGWWQAIADNVAACWQHANEYGATFGGPGALLFLAILGLLTMQGRQRTDATMVAALFGGLCVAGALYVMPHYPAEVFRRVWIPFVVVSSGAIGALAFRVIDGVRDILHDRTRYASGIAGTFVLTMLVFGGSAATIIAGVPDVINRFVSLRIASDFELDQSQPARTLPLLGPDQGVVYMNELPMHLYLLHGGMRHDTVYNPAVEGTREEDLLSNGTYDLRLAIGLHPNRFVTHTDGIWLPEDGDMRIELGPDSDWSDATLRISALSKDVEIEAVFTWPSGQSRPFRFTAPADRFTWIDLPPAPGATVLTLRPVDGGFSRLAGLRLESGAPTRWPWDRGVTVTPTPSEDIEDKVVVFDSQELVPDRCESRGVIDDTGVTIVTAIRCGSPASR